MRYLITSYIKEIDDLIGFIWEVFFLLPFRIPLLETIGGAESVSVVGILVLYVWIDRYVTLVAIVVCHIVVVLLLLYGGVTTTRLLNTVYLLTSIKVCVHFGVM